MKIKSLFYGWGVAILKMEIKFRLHKMKALLFYTTAAHTCREIFHIGNTHSS